MKNVSEKLFLSTTFQQIRKYSDISVLNMYTLYFEIHQASEINQVTLGQK